VYSSVDRFIVWHLLGGIGGIRGIIGGTLNNKRRIGGSVFLTHSPIRIGHIWRKCYE
jgi:hypothetical protein